MNINKYFFLAARGYKKHPGSIFTLEIPKSFQLNNKFSNSHFTYKIKYKYNSETSEKWFVSLLTGPDNTKNYTYIGCLNPDTGELFFTAKSKISNEAWSVRLLRRVLACLWEDSLDEIEKAGFDLHHEGKCGRCGKKLTHPESCKFGIGPICDEILSKAA